MFVEANLTRKQYEVIRSSVKKIYPSYSLIQKEKLKCYPDKESYRVNETCAEIRLQNLLDLTVKRFCFFLEEVLLTLGAEERESLTLVYKWGCDGSQQAQFKQKFESCENSDSNIFQSSFVPLRLISKCNNKVVWENPTPSSPRYCRPIRIRFIKETSDITKGEIAYIQSAIDSFTPAIIYLQDKCFVINHVMLLTMVDAKICNAACDNLSTMKCYICGATSKEFKPFLKETIELFLPYEPMETTATKENVSSEVSSDVSSEDTSDDTFPSDGELSSD